MAKISLKKYNNAYFPRSNNDNQTNYMCLHVEVNVEVARSRNKRTKERLNSLE